MGRKLKTTPLQREILWALANKGHESLVGLLNDLVLKFRSQSSTAILEEAERSIGVLEQQGFLYVVWQFGFEERPVLTTERTLIHFKDLFRWDEMSKQWQFEPREEPTFKDLILQLTQGGVEALDLISDQSSDRFFFVDFT